MQLHAADLIQNRENRVDFIGGALMYRQVNGDDNIGTPLFCYINRQVINESAGNQQTVLEPDRRKGSRCRNRCKNRQFQRPRRHIHFLTGQQIQRDGAKGHR